MCNGNMVRCPVCKGEREVPCDSEACKRSHVCRECGGRGEVFSSDGCDDPAVLAGELREEEYYTGNEEGYALLAQEFPEPEGRG